MSERFELLTGQTRVDIERQYCARVKQVPTTAIRAVFMFALVKSANFCYS